MVAHAHGPYFDDDHTMDDSLAPARGLLLGSLLGAAAWIAIGLLVWLLLF